VILLPTAFGSGVTSRASLAPIVVIAVFLATAFGSDIGMAAPLVPTCAAPQPLLLEPLDFVLHVVFLAVTFGSDVGMGPAMAPMCTVPELPPLEMHTYSTTVLLGSYCPTDGAPRWRSRRRKSSSSSSQGEQSERSMPRHLSMVTRNLL
jgi:hypothetical protein